MPHSRPKPILVSQSVSCVPSSWGRGDSGALTSLLQSPACSCGPFLPWLTFGQTHIRVLGGMLRFLSTAFLILGFICIPGLGKGLRADFPCSRDTLRSFLKPFVQRLRGFLSPFLGLPAGRGRVRKSQGQPDCTRQGGKPSGQAWSLQSQFCSLISLPKHKPLHL